MKTNRLVYMSEAAPERQIAAQSAEKVGDQVIKLEKMIDMESKEYQKQVNIVADRIRTEPEKFSPDLLKMLAEKYDSKEHGADILAAILDIPTGVNGMSQEFKEKYLRNEGSMLFLARYADLAKVQFSQSFFDFDKTMRFALTENPTVTRKLLEKLSEDEAHTVADAAKKKLES